jgi:drug/metabolite transporter (DMT)-like permease
VSASGLVWPVLLFVVVGLSDVGLKVRVELFPASDSGWFFAIMFATACVICLVVALIARTRPSARSFGIGALLGTVNFGTAFFLSAALEQLAGFRVYTLNSVGVIIVAAILGIVLWREWPGRHNYIFLGGSIAAIILLSG